MKKLILLVLPIIIFSLVTAIVLLLLNYWIGGVSLLLFSFIVNYLSKTFALHLYDRGSNEYDFRVLTFNINRAHTISVNKGTTEELIDLILQQKADLVLFQEYNVELYPEIQERLNIEYPYSCGNERTSRYKTIFTRFPIESCEQLKVDANDSKYELFQNAMYCKKTCEGKEVLPISRMTIKIEERHLQVFNCHLMSNNFSVIIRNLKKKGKTLLQGILPILYRMDYGYQARELQSEIISSCLDLSYPSLVCGDFNDICGSKPLQVLSKQGLSDAWWKGGFGFGFTFHGMGLKFRLDHILYSEKNLSLVNVTVPHSDVSDHNPIVCDFKFKN